jgi:hypothetical protein
VGSGAGFTDSVGLRIRGGGLSVRRFESLGERNSYRETTRLLFHPTLQYRRSSPHG